MTDGSDELHDEGMEHSPTSATGTAWERTPWARDGVGARGESRSKRAEDAGWMLPLFTSAW
jgi:hypothetical protein